MLSTILAIVCCCLIITLAFVLPLLPSKEKNIKQLKVPETHVKLLLELSNKAQTDKDGKKDYLAHYELWNFIENLFPETKIGHWRWRQHGTDLYVIQTAKKTKL